ncbi:MAG: hypothetical protein CAF42_010120 [Nitrospira sp. CG24B]|nr:MAG: hypothetical protein CAF42_010120 [Nitrospira sp. CG24B]
MDTNVGKFGFLPIDKTISFSGGAFSLLEDFNETMTAVRSATNADGFVYPPLEKQMRGQPKILDGQLLPEDQWDWKAVSGTERPAHLHRLPASHGIQLEQTPIDNDLRRNDGAFLMYLAGYLYGYRLQFHDWWFDGRVKMKKSHNAYVGDDKAVDFFSESYSVWKNWSMETRRHFTNILYMNSRLELYEWDWERFMIAYMVFDACYKQAKELGQVRSPPSHAGRIDAMCGGYGLYCNSSLSSEIAKLRNALFHEALWDGGQPCSSGGQKSFYYTECLRGINRRLIPAMLGYSTAYIGTQWDSISPCQF